MENANAKSGSEIEFERRQAKVDRLTEVMTRHNLDFSLAILMTKDEWQRLATATGVNMPSAKTRLQVLHRLADRTKTP